jgi:phosphopantothenoylcysteine decarboxylase/phosphopantothenate--cysteine ligase
MGAGVTVAMTRSAQKFITPLTMESLSGRQVFISLWSSGEAHDPQHLSLTESADLFIVAPATANMIAKMVHGIADEVVSTMALSVASPILIAPAMNTRMWENPAVQENIATLKRRGVRMIGPGEGWLACRTVGMGRMSEAEEILSEAVALLRESPPKRKASR